MVDALFPWQAEVARDALARRDAWPHGLLLTGSRGIGKRALALHFARALLCESPREDGSACGTCASCGYISAGQHPDLRVLDLVEVDEEGETKALAEIKIDSVRDLSTWSLLTSHRGVAKVGIIDPAEALNIAAANALLKTLEEPPPSTFFILISHQPGQVAPTLRSRCLRLATPRPSREQAAAWLADKGAGNAEAVLAQADGAPLAALRLADAGWQEERGVWLAALAKPSSLPAVALASRVESGAREERRERLTFAIDWLAAWTADLARVRVGGPPTRNPDFADDLRALAPSVAPAALFRYHRSLAEQRALVTHPLQPRLVAEALLLGYRELFV
jgi:DNA polymerase III subunit delta'